MWEVVPSMNRSLGTICMREWGRKHTRIPSLPHRAAYTGQPMHWRMEEPAEGRRGNQVRRVAEISCQNSRGSCAAFACKWRWSDKCT